MTLLRLVFVIGLALAAGCQLSPQLPDGAQREYPPIIKESSDRRNVAEREWRRLLDAYEAPSTPPEFHPVLYTPRSLSGLAGQIQLLQVRPEPGTEKAALREAVRRFINRWRELVGIDISSLSLVAAGDAGGGQRLIFQQANYPFPVVGGYGELVAIISAEGRLMQLDSRVIPIVDVPPRPALEREAVAQRLVGRTFNYADIAGRPQSVRVNGLNEVSVKRLVVVPVEQDQQISVHLAWEAVVGTSLTWTVYLDAMNGAELKVAQNFNT